MTCNTALLEWAPQKKPRLWFLVDTICCLYSFLLLFLDIVGTDDSLGKTLVQGHYLFYSWITTSLWLLLVGLDIAHDGFDTASRKQRVELLLAFIFTGSSCVELLEWKLRDQNMQLIGLDMLFNGMAYAYQSRQAFVAGKHLNTIDEGYVDIGEAPNLPV